MTSIEFKHVMFMTSETAFKLAVRHDTTGWIIVHDVPRGTIRIDESNTQAPRYNRRRKHGGQWPKLRHS